MSNDKMAERARFEQWYTTHACNYSRDPIGSRDCSMQWEAWDAALQAHAAEAAQAQAQSGEWVQKAIVDAKGDVEYVHVRIFNAMKARAEEAEAMLAAAPQPQAAQDASKYQELLMAVEKKFPGESRHETALRYIRQAELRSCEPKCDAEMAKESGR